MDTSAAENVMPKLYNPVHKEQDNGKRNMSKVFVARKFMNRKD